LADALNNQQLCFSADPPPEAGYPEEDRNGSMLQV